MTVCPNCGAILNEGEFCKCRQPGPKTAEGRRWGAGYICPACNKEIQEPQTCLVGLAKKPQPTCDAGHLIIKPRVKFPFLFHFAIATFLLFAVAFGVPMFAGDFASTLAGAGTLTGIIALLATIVVVSGAVSETIAGVRWYRKGAIAAKAATNRFAAATGWFMGLIVAFVTPLYGLIAQFVTSFHKGIS